MDDLLCLLDSYWISYRRSVDLVDSAFTNSVIACQSGVLKNGLPGRPKVLLNEEQVIGLRSLNMPWKKIVELLGVGEKTLRRKRKTFSVPCSTYTELNDTELDITLREITLHHPNSGEIMIQGFLVGKGYRVKRWRVRSSLKRIDPHRRQRFLKKQIRRRSYSVALILIVCG